MKNKDIKINYTGLKIDDFIIILKQDYFTLIKHSYFINY